MHPEMDFTAIRRRSAGEAVQHASADGRFDTAILMGSDCYAVERREAERLEAAGVAFTYLFERNGHIVTVPVN